MQTSLRATQRLRLDSGENFLATISSNAANVYTGRLNLCMDCDYYTVLDKGAEEHSKRNSHSVWRREVHNIEITKEKIRLLKEDMRLP